MKELTDAFVFRFPPKPDGFLFISGSVSSVCIWVTVPHPGKIHVMMKMMMKECS